MIKYLDIWTAEKLGVPPEKLSREIIEAYQLAKLQETLAYATANSPFYRERYGGHSITSFSQMSDLPLTCPADLRECGREMICVSQSQISRIVTLETSGTTGQPKRIYFTEADQERTVDFFHHGMRFVVDRGDKVMILMPCRRPGSIGDLLKTGLERLGAAAVPYGPPAADLSDASRILRRMKEEGVTSVVALPTQLAALAALSALGTAPAAVSLRSVLLSAEYVSEESRAAIGKAWGCPIFEHYGMTEMGLGGAVSCQKREGCHVRESDLYIEIIDPRTGQAVEDGQWGEVVFTTLTRKGMPFIRYRTGDMCRWLTEPCGCGSVLRRLARVGDRGLEKGGPG